MSYFVRLPCGVGKKARTKTTYVRSWARRHASGGVPSASPVAWETFKRLRGKKHAAGHAIVICDSRTWKNCPYILIFSFFISPFFSWPHVSSLFFFKTSLGQRSHEPSAAAGSRERYLLFFYVIVFSFLSHAQLGISSGRRALRRCCLSAHTLSFISFNIFNYYYLYFIYLLLLLLFLIALLCDIYLHILM